MIIGDKDIDLMRVEARLDRIQCSIRNKKYKKAYKESCLALGEVRSVIDYHIRERQKTLLPFLEIHPSGLSTKTVQHGHPEKRNYNPKIKKQFLKAPLTKEILQHES